MTALLLSLPVVACLGRFYVLALVICRAYDLAHKLRAVLAVAHGVAIPDVQPVAHGVVVQVVPQAHTREPPIGFSRAHADAVRVE